MKLVEQSFKPIIGGHEKFVFRYGWLKKGVDALLKDATLFTNDEAPVILGVGKNMVRSIRHWCLAAGLFEETRGKKSGSNLQLTDLGRRMMADDGWDPYLEDPGTLWLLHWQLASNSTRTLVWHLTFCTYHDTEFTKRQLTAFVSKQLERRQITTTIGAIEREIDVCLRTYASTTRGTTADGILEETLDCPLVELDLIRFFSEDNVYRFNIGGKATLPAEVFGYTLLKYLPKVIGTRRTVTVDECLYGDGSPGHIFKLDENSIIEYLETMEQLTDGRLRLQETAGLRQLYLEYETEEWFGSAALDLLDRHYARTRN